MGRTGQIAATACLAAICFTATSDAGLVGTTCSISFYGASGSNLLERTFAVSSLLPEYYYWEDLGTGWGAFTADVRDNSLVITVDFDPAFTAGVFFATPTRLTLSIPDTLQFTAFELGGSSGFGNVQLNDVTGSGTRTMTIDTSGYTAATLGAYFTVDFTTSTIPAPSAFVVATILLAPCRGRRRIDGVR